jgi:hypothetical protein
MERMMFGIHLMRLVALLTLTSLAVAACGDDGVPDPPSALERHQALWESQAFESYQFGYEPTGFAANVNEVVTVTVLEGAVVAVERRDGTPLVSAPPLTAIPTIERLFEQIRVAEAGEGVTRLLSAEYNATLGFPTSATFEDTSETYGFAITGLVVIDESCLDEGASCPREQTLAASAARWLAVDPVDTTPYCLERVSTSFTGDAWESFTEVETGAVAYWRVRIYDAFGEETFEEIHEGTGPADDDPRVASMNALYARCRDAILTRPAEAYEVVLELDDQGLLAQCYATDALCADDCTIGVAVHALTFEACERPAEPTE